MSAAPPGNQRFELENNDLFIKYEDMRGSALTICREFLGKISPMAQSRIRKIILLEANNNKLQNLVMYREIGQVMTGQIFPSIRKFCFDKSGAQILLRYDTAGSWNRSTVACPYLLVISNALRMALRSTPVEDYLIDDDELVLANLARWVQMHKSELENIMWDTGSPCEPIPKNLRITPTKNSVRGDGVSRLPSQRFLKARRLWDEGC